MQSLYHRVRRELIIKLKY